MKVWQISSLKMGQKTDRSIDRGYLGKKLISKARRQHSTDILAFIKAVSNYDSMSVLLREGGLIYASGKEW